MGLGSWTQDVDVMLSASRPDRILVRDGLADTHSAVDPFAWIAAQSSAASAYARGVRCWRKYALCSKHFDNPPVAWFRSCVCVPAVRHSVLPCVFSSAHVSRSLVWAGKLSGTALHEIFVNTFGEQARALPLAPLEAWQDQQAHLNITATLYTLPHRGVRGLFFSFVGCLFAACVCALSC
jgi:hypothetical protein